VRDHVKIGKGVMIGGQSGVGHDIPDGQMFSGTPAIPHRTWMKAQSIYSKLPEYIRRLRDLERKIEKEDNGNAG
jgi:UDP-3-O-[3-hydroxymyristoyl] glucosamine N-acyltransferase